MTRLEELIMMLKSKGLTDEEIEEELCWAKDNYRETPPEEVESELGYETVR